jgi:hypothetical protein
LNTKFTFSPARGAAAAKEGDWPKKILQKIKFQTAVRQEHGFFKNGGGAAIHTP